MPWFLLGDRDAKGTCIVDDVVAADGIQIITTPVQAPNAGAVAKRWVPTVRQEGLGWMLVWGRRQLARVLDESVRHDNSKRPHQGLARCPPRALEV